MSIPSSIPLCPAAAPGSAEHRGCAAHRVRASLLQGCHFSSACFIFP